VVQAKMVDQKAMMEMGQGASINRGIPKILRLLFKSWY
jgi:hypothetical protein